jgi:hypothetical protein
MGANPSRPRGNVQCPPPLLERVRAVNKPSLKTPRDNPPPAPTPARRKCAGACHDRVLSDQAHKTPAAFD